jgi:hypothetical protein
MSEGPLPESRDAAIRWYLATLSAAFIVAGVERILHGVYGFTALIVGTALSLSVYKWAWLKKQIDPRMALTLSQIATDAKWWVLLTMIILLAIIATPFVEQRRWPRVPFISEPLFTGTRANVYTLYLPLYDSIKQKLGNPVRPEATSDSVYEAAHERALVLWIKPFQRFYILPSGHDFHAIIQSDNYYDLDLNLGNDAYLRTIIKTPENKLPPQWGVAKVWQTNPSVWEQILGWRSWSCAIDRKDFRYQEFQNGIIIGPLRIGKGINDGQVIAILNDNTWDARSLFHKSPSCE